jgi:hypothetical protein
MKQIIISSDTPNIKSLEKVENNSAAAFVNPAFILYITMRSIKSSHGGLSDWRYGCDGS